MESGPGILSRSCIALEFDETFEGRSFVPEPRCILTCFRFVAARHRAEKSYVECQLEERGEGQRRGCRFPLSLRENIKLRLDRRFSCIISDMDEKRKRKKHEGIFFFLSFLILETDDDYYSVRFAKGGEEERMKIGGFFKIMIEELYIRSVR